MNDAIVNAANLSFWQASQPALQLTGANVPQVSGAIVDSLAWSKAVS